MVFAAVVTLPKNLSRSDQKVALEILGFGSQAKLLSSPVPLGGKQGFEFGLSSEYIPVSDIGTLGSKSSTKGEFNFLNLSVGKGLPYNVDTFLQFTPIPQSDGAFGYGGHLRWGFLEFERFPAIMSFLVHGNGMNFSNVLATRTTGLDLVVTVAVDEASLYFGGGTMRSIGTFNGGTGGITASNETEEMDLSGAHAVFGLSFNFEKVFLALEVDRVVQSVYAGRLGYRF